MLFLSEPLYTEDQEKKILRTVEFKNQARRPMPNYMSKSCADASLPGATDAQGLLGPDDDAYALLPRPVIIVCRQWSRVVFMERLSPCDQYISLLSTGRMRSGLVLKALTSLWLGLQLSNA